LICCGISSVGGSSILKITSGFGFFENSQNQKNLFWYIGVLKILRIKEPLLVFAVLKIHRIKEPLLVLGF
jgi:hypothetical protein